MIDPEHDFAMPYAHDELRYDRHTDIVQNLSRETITFRNEMNETALPMREIGSFKPGECVGGAGVHWGGMTQRFLPWDFETRSRTVERYGEGMIPEDCTSQDWGITYDELEPYYDQFEHLYGIGGKAGNLNGEIQPGGNPFEGPRSREFPNPPKQQTYAGHLFEKAAESLGYKPFPMPTATMTRPYTNPYRLMLGECVNGGFCGHYGCAKGAKATPLTTVLPALLKHENFELRTLANVTKVNLDSTGKRAVGVTYVDAQGREIEQPAELVILASYVFNNTRLHAALRHRQALRSGHARAWWAGTTRMRRTARSALLRGQGVQPIHGRRRPRHRHRRIQRRQLRPRRPRVLRRRVSHRQQHRRRADPLPPVPPGTPHWGAGWKKAVAQYYDRSMQMIAHGGCQSYRQNYLDLDPTYRDAHGLPLIRADLRLARKRNQHVRFHDEESRGDREGHRTLADERRTGQGQIQHRPVPEHAQYRRRGHGAGSRHERRQQVFAIVGCAERVRDRRQRVSAEQRQQPDRHRRRARVLGGGHDQGPVSQAPGIADVALRLFTKRS